MTTLMQRRMAGRRVRSSAAPTGTSFVSAAIDSTGEELTVTLTGNATITNATGWTIEFDNYAERVLTYSSGSGSNALVFAISANPTYTAEGTNNDAAPVGATATISYDSGTGNAIGLGSITDGAVTNNSTVIPDPDLPEEVDASLPANWNATADHTPANGTALQALFDDFGGTLNAGDVIELDADVDYGTITIPADVQGDASNWIIVRSDEYASLPAYGSRVVEADEQYMPTISRAPTAAVQPALHVQQGDGVYGASYIRFIGIKFEATGSGYAGTNYLGPVAVGAVNESGDFAEMPQWIGFDRCIITQDDTVNSWHNDIQADYYFFVGCCFHNLWGGGNDGSNAIRSNNCSHVLIENNYFECMGATAFFGDAQNPSPDGDFDVTYRLNYHLHPTEWDDGSHGISKSSFETKVCLRLLMERNVFQNQSLASYNLGHATVSLKGEKNSTSQVTIRGNQILDSRRAFALLSGASFDDADSGPNTDFLLVDNFIEASNFSLLVWVGDNAGDTRMARLACIRNTIIHGNAFAVWFDKHYTGTTPGSDLLFRDNIVLGGLWAGGESEGADSLNNAWGSDYSGTYNLLIGRSATAYDSDTTPTPTGTLANNSFPADVAAVGFTDSGNGDYSVDNGSDYATASSTGGKPGYDSATYDSIWAGVTP